MKQSTKMHNGMLIGHNKLTLPTEPVCVHADLICLLLHDVICDPTDPQGCKGDRDGV